MTEIGAASACAGRATRSRCAHHRRPAAARNSSSAIAAGRGKDPGGEIQVRGPHVTPGYYRRPEATAEAFDGDGSAPATSARIDAGGNMRISGRAKELVHVGGFNVFPAEVEDFLLTHPDVVAGGRAGVPHERMGEALRAFVVPRPGVRRSSAAELLRFARAEDRRLQAAVRRSRCWTSCRCSASGKPDRAALLARPRARGERCAIRGRRRSGAWSCPLAALGRAPLFDGLEPAELVTRSPLSMELREFEPGEGWLREGEPGQSMLVIVDGLVNEVTAMIDSPEQRSRSVLAEGRLRGQAAPRRRGGRRSADHGRAAAGYCRARPSPPPRSSCATGGLRAPWWCASRRSSANLSRHAQPPARRGHARQAARGPGPRRGGGAVVGRLAVPDAVPAVLAAARAASARLGGGRLTRAGSLERALLATRRPAARAPHGGSSRPGSTRSALPLLLEQVDRAVVLAGERGRSALARIARRRRGSWWLRTRGRPSRRAARLGVVRACVERRGDGPRAARRRGLARPPRVAHQARAGAGRGRRQGLRPHRARCRCSRRRATRSTAWAAAASARSWAPISRSGWAPPRSRPRCARPSPRRPWPRSSSSSLSGESTGLRHDAAHLPRDDRARAQFEETVDPVRGDDGRPRPTHARPAAGGAAMGGAHGRHGAGGDVPAVRARRPPAGRRPGAGAGAHGRRGGGRRRRDRVREHDEPRHARRLARAGRPRRSRPSAAARACSRHCSR